MPTLVQRIAITGATGLIGSSLALRLANAGHAVLPLSRDAGNPVRWNPENGEITGVDGCDAVVHLAGRNIAQRWTAARRAVMWNSRVEATEKLCRTLAAMPIPPKLLISASGVGFYGDRGDEVLTEESAGSETEFTARLCAAWEKAVAPARDAGVQVIVLRIGVVLSPRGGALRKLLLPARLGLTGPIAGGRQWVPWIGLEDVVGLIHHLLVAPGGQDVINAVAPQCVRQREFIQTLGKVLRRPAVLPMPAAVVKLLFGQMGVETLLTSLRVTSMAMPAGFEFSQPTLEGALRSTLRIPLT